MNRIYKTWAWLLTVVMLLGILGVPARAEDVLETPVETQSEEVEAQSETIDFTIASVGECGAQPDVADGRWLLRFYTSVEIPGSGFSSYMGDGSIMISGGGTSGTAIGNFYDGGSAGDLGMIVPFTSLPQDAEGYGIILPEGLEVTDGTMTYRLAETVFCYNENGVWQLVQNQLTVQQVETGAWQENLSRWLFRIAMSDPIEPAAEEFSSATLGNISITVTPPEGSGRKFSVTAYYADNPDGTSTNRLGFVVNESEGLPQDADGYSVTIHPGTLQSANLTYQITTACTIRYTGGVWQIVTDRPLGTGVLGDANGDGTFNTLDLIRMKKESMGVEGVRCTEDALFAGKTVLTDYDMTHIREMFLNRVGSDETYVPIYLDDEDIELAAYKGPRSEGRDYRYDDDGNMLSGYTKKNFLTDTEFARYAAAGLNTLVAESDVPFVSENGDLMASGGGHWTNIVEYMNLAANQDLDVYLMSDAINAYLRGDQATKADGSGTQVTVTDEFMQQDLTQLLTGVGSATHGGYASQFNPTGKLEGMLDYDNFKGLMLADEIRYDSLGYYTKVNQFLRSIAPDIEVITAFESSGTAVGVDYQTFATSYAKASLSNSFMYDYYPFQGQATKKLNTTTWTREYDFDAVTPTTNADWITKLEELAGYALSEGFETGIALSSMGMNNHSSGIKFGAPTAKRDIGFQVYTALAYGMKSIRYFTYWENEAQAVKDGVLGSGKVGEVYTNSMVTVDADGNVVETDIYRAVQAVNMEILEFDHVFLDYDWRSAIKIGTGDQVNGLTQGSSDRVESYEATDAAIIGCMRDEEKNLDGFWLVNATEPEEDKSNTITVTFKDAESALIYNPEEGIYGEEISLDNGSYTARLDSGAAQFIIPLL